MEGRGLILIVFGIFACSLVLAANDDDFEYGTFPDGFAWAVATAAYQIEGGWNASGKGMNIWDYYTHKYPDRVATVNGSDQNGDVACDSYNNWERDIEMLKELGVTHYRFSLSWSRLLPDGTPNKPNQDGIDYYTNILKKLKDAGIQPEVTLYHWDLPQALQDQGNGWLNPKSVDWFGDYADFCFKTFGDWVKLWLTHNEPLETAWDGYGHHSMAPGLGDIPSRYPYQVSKNLILSHARAWHIYNDTYRATQKGQVGLTMNTDWSEPYDSTNQSDVDAADRRIHFQLGWFANAIFSKNGDWPEVMKSLILNKSIAAGLNESRLPAFSQSEIDYVKGAADFLGVNVYTTRLARHQINDPQNSTYDTDSDTIGLTDPNWPTSGSSWLYVVPWGMRKLLKWIKTNYPGYSIYVMENGVSDDNGTLDDPWRTYYYQSYINEMLKAIRREGVDVKGYAAWSLMDNFEWLRGYTEKFGLYQVDFFNPSRPRTMKNSAKVYQQIIKNNGFPNPNATTTATSPTSQTTSSNAVKKDHAIAGVVSILTSLFWLL